ncbi:MAG: tetratricopeptide repeat protein [Nitrospirae bacterium]|nr:tetratricopeptide repeat protein [Nitrospirota bacterium]
MRTSREIFDAAKYLLVKGKVVESIDAFTQAINSGEKSDIAFLSRGVAYLRNYQAEKAICDFDEAIKVDDNNARAHYYRGMAYMMLENYEEAIADFDKTIELDPENGAAFFARGTAYANIGNDELATKNIKTAITFSESGIYGLQESIGLLRTQFDRTLSIVEGDRKPYAMALDEDEIDKLKKWLTEGYKGEVVH